MKTSTKNLLFAGLVICIVAVVFYCVTMNNNDNSDHLDQNNQTLTSEQVQKKNTSKNKTPKNKRNKKQANKVNVGHSNIGGEWTEKQKQIFNSNCATKYTNSDTPVNKKINVENYCNCLGTAMMKNSYEPSAVKLAVKELQHEVSRCLIGSMTKT